MEILVKIFIYSWIISIFFGVIVAISYPIFRDYAEVPYEVYIPLYNLFGLCSFNGYDEKLGLLFLVPFVNIGLMMYMSFKLKNKYDLDSLFSTGLLLLPPIFMPLLAYSNKEQSDSDESSYTYKEESDDEPEVKIQKVNIKGKKKEEEEAEVFEAETYNEDDSIFKIQSKSQGETNNKPYKAKRVRVNEQFINSAPAEQEKIERVEKGGN